MAKSFKISNVKAIHKNSLVASFDLEMPSGLVIKSTMLMESHGRRWISFPAQKIPKGDGATTWANFICFRDRETGDRFNSLVVPRIEKELDPNKVDFDDAVDF